ncbi:MAG: VOC family protein [Saprospiraceae bacterium]|nr:VOC family protein [Saprospiraceae bacterium]
MKYFFQEIANILGASYQSCFFCHSVGIRPLYGGKNRARPARRADSSLQDDKHKVHRFVLLLLAFCLPLVVFPQKVTAVTGVSITVEDLAREVDFFVKNLDFQKIKEETLAGEEVAKLYGLPENTASVQIVTLQLGTEKIQLMDFSPTPALPGREGDSRPVPPDTRSNDLWFQHLAIVVSDMDAAYQRLLKNKVAHVSTSPQTLPDYLPNAAGIEAFYFRDPEGHNLELIWFPTDKGNPRWQPSTVSREPSTVFLGIDHTAIGIADTDTSMAFYRDALGLVHSGHSENYGTEQEHLNQVFGARLDINGLHAEAGFGVEFLRYIAPPGGRPYPTDSRPTDLWHYQTELEVDDLPKMLEKLEHRGFRKISTAVAKIGNAEMFLLRDPDGHAVLLKSQEKKKKG